MTRIVFAIVLLTVLFGLAQPVLADGPRLMREDAPSFAPALELKQVYHIEHSKRHIPDTGLIRRIAPPTHATWPLPPACPEVCIQ